VREPAGRAAPPAPVARSAQAATSQRGSVTAETAVALPALVVVLALALWAVGTVDAQLRCVDAARLAARALARGDPRAAAVAAAEQAAPPGAGISVTQSGQLVTVVVSLRVAMTGAWTGSPGLQVQGRASADAEDAERQQP
jgi:hypothetical protein